MCYFSQANVQPGTSPPLIRRYTRRHLLRRRGGHGRAVATPSPEGGARKIYWRFDHAGRNCPGPGLGGQASFVLKLPRGGPVGFNLLSRFQTVGPRPRKGGKAGLTDTTGK